MKIIEYLRTCREMSRFCTQNGWIDNATLAVNIIAKEGNDKLIVDVRFEEVIMEGSGCVAARMPCWGQMRLHLDQQRQVLYSELL